MKGEGKGKFTMKLKTRFIKQNIHPNSTIGTPVIMVHRQKRTPEAYIFGKNPRATSVA